MKRLRHLRPILALSLLALLSAAPSLAQPDDLERSVALMAKIGSATSPSFSPDGKTIAFVSNISGLPQVWTSTRPADTRSSSRPSTIRSASSSGRPTAPGSRSRSRRAAA